MVNITHKAPTLRKAIATAVVQVSSQGTIDAINNRLVPKGDVFEFARAAGLLAIKKTSDVIPDCHPLPVEYASITYNINQLALNISVEVHTIYKTGVEVEAMHGAAVTALVIYDMLKPIDHHVEILHIRLQEKTGGKTDLGTAGKKSLTSSVIVCSDSISNGKGVDTAGKSIVNILQNYLSPVPEYRIIADDFDTIQSSLKDAVSRNTNLVIFTGGTGLSKRDCTPDAVEPLIERSIPGIMETARSYGQSRTRYAMLSRGVAGFINDTLVLTLPGSQKGAEETMQAIFPQLLHVFEVREGSRH
ncbi:MAG TPA: bifunctional molybdenum cofactor biosynthesis protein MoaC/MoaB [Chryseolinea sp.]|nr:bifunctional molybdenum cofactor biosynthesis protein MoaC/MoaB [Chryseolinea sp.]